MSYSAHTYREQTPESNTPHQTRKPNEDFHWIEKANSDYNSLRK